MDRVDRGPAASAITDRASVGQPLNPRCAEQSSASLSRLVRFVVIVVAAAVVLTIAAGYEASFKTMLGTATVTDTMR